jgi:drug/metabolite transporter (DMT)-like permease
MDKPAPTPHSGERQTGAASFLDNKTFLAAIGYMALGTLMFSGSHGIVRWASPGVHPMELAFLSNAFSALVFVPWILRRGLGLLYTKRFALHALRAMFNVGSITTWYWAITITPLADATALSVTAPLFATLGAVLFLGEPMRLRRWLALLAGLVGGLFIVQPQHGFDAFSTGYLLVLASCVFSSGSRVIAKTLSSTDSPLVCSAYVAMLQTPFSLLFASFVWTTPSAVQLSAMAIVGVMVAAAQYLTVESLRSTEIGAIESFNYLRLIWAAAIGYFAFGEISELTTWIGAAFIVAATTFIARREAKARSREAKPAD